jgi:cyclopropane fatty-acyl-phospholipid synthase-like methyltransferase
MTDRPYSPAAERNREPILKVLRSWLPRSGRMLEIGAGSGQHVLYFAPVFPLWQWQPTDHPDELPTLQAGLLDHGLANIEKPLALDVSGNWPGETYDAAYSANTAHIMHYPEVEAMFAGVGQHLNPGGLFVLYGPFMRSGSHNAPSNADFDASLRRRDPGMGIRDLDDLDRLAARCGLQRIAELRMPANNHILIFHKSDG